MARKLYEKQNWENKPSKKTPVRAEELLHIENGIYENSANMALKEVYGDHSIRLSVGNGEQTSPDIMSIEAGYMAKATDAYSAAIGNNVEASKMGSFATGRGTRADGYEQFVCGRYNEAAGSDMLFIIGNGTADSDRKSIHTVDYHGNAYFAGDVANDRYSLDTVGAMLEAAGTADITEMSTAVMSGQVLEVTVPLNDIFSHADAVRYGVYPACGDFAGVIYTSDKVPFFFNLQAAVIKDGEMSGRAVLVNTVPQSTGVLGYKFDGEIELVSAGTAGQKVKVTFDLGRSATVQSFMVFRTAGSAVDFSIAQLREELQDSTITADSLPSYDDVMSVLDGQAGEERVAS